MNESKYIKMMTNIARTLTFRYTDGKEKDNNYKGQQYKSWLCGVIDEHGQERYLDVPAPAYEDLKAKFGDLRDLTLVVNKVEEGRSKRWTFDTPANVGLNAGVAIANAERAAAVPPSHPTPASAPAVPYTGKVRTNPPVEPLMTGSMEQLAEEARGGAPVVTSADLICPMMQNPCIEKNCAWAIKSVSGFMCAVKLIGHNIGK